MTIDEKYNILAILQCILSIKQDEVDYMKQLITMIESSTFADYDKTLLEQSVSSLCLSVRTYNALKRAGIVKVRDFTRLTHRKLREVRNLGEKSYNEVLQKLKELDVNLADD